MRKQVDPQERRWRAYLLTERLREQAETGDDDPEPYLAQAAAIEADYGGWSETDTSPPRPVHCPACATQHPAGYNCPEKRDALWSLLKDKEVAGPIKEYARAALGLGDKQEDVGVVFVTGGPVPAIPCATCGAMPVGVFGDGTPRYDVSCSHPPIYPEV